MTDIVKRLRKWASEQGEDFWAQSDAELMHAAAAEIERLRLACTKMNDEVCQRLGKALGYPWFKDDQTNFSGATEENGVCTGEHVAESIAAEAANEIERLREALLMWLSADDAGDGQECINAIAHARAVLEGAPVPYEPTGLEYRGG